MKSAPSQAPCPTCGQLGKRKSILHRQVRTIAYPPIVYRDLTYGEYRARCGCGTTFRTTPPGVEPRALDDHKVRDAVRDRILDDGRSIEQVLRSMRRDFLLDLSDGFVSDGLHRQVRQWDRSDHRRWVLERFSGTWWVDELHLGKDTHWRATDPLPDFPVAFAVVSSHDPDPRRRFLPNLPNWGLEPEVVVTEGSALDPALLAHLGPQARHQLCLFPVWKAGHKEVLDTLRRRRRQRARRGHRGRPPTRGRRRKTLARRRGLTPNEQSAVLFKHRCLIVRRRNRMSPQERLDLEKMRNDLPEWKTLRSFVDRLELWFETGPSAALAWGRHAALTRNARFLASPELARAIGMVGAEKFAKRIAFWKSPVYHRVRTHNHVERVNRQLRYPEKARDQWRKRRTLVRFLVLLRDRYWKQERRNRSRWHEEGQPQPHHRSSPKEKPGKQVV